MRDEKSARNVALLQRSTLFAGLDAATLGKLADRARLCDFQAGAVIFRAGAPGESMMVVARGTVRITAMAPSARDVILTELDEGSVFGEIGLLDGAGRTADAHALTKCTLLVLERRELLKVLRGNPELAVALLGLLCARLRRSDARMMDLAFLPLPPRLARTLLRLASGSGEAGEKPGVRLANSQSELADMVGGARENVNRCLRAWQKDGLIGLDKGWIVLRNLDGLRAIAEAD